MGLLKWPGAKWSLGYQIAALFPEHRIYIDAFLVQVPLSSAKSRVTRKYLMI